MAYDAWRRLGPERITGMGEGFIPWSQVREYADEVGMDAIELLDVIRALDKEYLEYRRKSEEEKRARDKRSAERARLPRRGR